MVPNLREIGLLSDRIRPHYERVGLARYFEGRAADRLVAEDLLQAAPPDGYGGPVIGGAAA